MAAHGIIRRLLVAGVTGSLLLPIVVAVVTGLGVLLEAVGDAAAAVVCGRVALIAGVAWLVALVTTAVASGAALLDDRPASAEAEQRSRP